MNNTSKKSSHLKPVSKHCVLTPENNHRLALLCGQCDENIQLLQSQLDMRIQRRGYDFTLTGSDAAVRQAEKVLQSLYRQAKNNNPIELNDVHLKIRETISHQIDSTDKNDIVLHTKMGGIRGRTPTQKHYLQRIMSNTINFGIGPAGTGKTFLAVACAVDALEKDLVRRLVLVRPAVEAGERLGFLPGDLSQKVNPYLRPIYDALYSMLGFERVEQLLEKSVIEVAPLAYMRGRTLNDAFIILDESQNTTIEQMKMFLTRIGFGSRAVITGDVTQIDLLSNQRSGLKHVMQILKNLDDISFTYFAAGDVLRHPVVQSVLNAYEADDVAQRADS